MRTSREADGHVRGDGGDDLRQLAVRRASRCGRCAECLPSLSRRSAIVPAWGNGERLRPGGPSWSRAGAPPAGRADHRRAPRKPRAPAAYTPRYSHKARSRRPLACQVSWLRLDPSVANAVLGREPRAAARPTEACAMSDVPVPTPTTSLALDEINPGSFDFWLRDDVHGALARLRRERPIAWHQHPDSGRGFWSLTRFDDIVAASRDWETFSSAYGIQVLTDPEDTDRIGIRSMISTDPPKHTKLRSIVNRGFTPRMVAKAEDSVRHRAREIVDTIAPKGRVEFVSEVSSALPVAIICDMVGVPEADSQRLLDLTNRLLAGGDPEYGGTKESLAQAGHELRDYGLWLGKSRLENPQEDIATTLVHAEVDGEALPPEDLGPFILLPI